VYVLGSQFGSKAGPLSSSRSWIARVPEAALGGDGAAPLQIARLRFGLHRAVNDALARSGIELIERGPLTTERYIDTTIARGAAQAKRWAGRVTAADHPINVEGMEFRANGRLLLALRYPVSAGGHPLLVEVDDVGALFADPDAVPSCSQVWELENAGGCEQPMGVRALHTDGDDVFHAVVGDLDAAGKGATVLADHPAGGRATSRHVRFSLPQVAAGGAVSVDTVHEFGAIKRVEGIALAPDGHAHYVIDEEGHVALRTLLLAAPGPDSRTGFRGMNRTAWSVGHVTERAASRKADRSLYYWCATWRGGRDRPEPGHPGRPRCGHPCRRSGPGPTSRCG
jgi:hypothetical protein